MVPEIRTILPVLPCCLAAGILTIAGNTQAAGLVPPPTPLEGNSNYWITAADPSASTGLPITGFTVASLSHRSPDPQRHEHPVDRVVSADFHHRLAAVRVLGRTARAGLGNRKLADKCV